MGAIKKLKSLLHPPINTGNPVLTVNELAEKINKPVAYIKLLLGNLESNAIIEGLEYIANGGKRSKQAARLILKLYIKE